MAVDERIIDNSDEMNDELENADTEYDNKISDVHTEYKGLIDAENARAEVLKQEQQERTDHIISDIKQQKEQAHKDYVKEQSGAYVDWQKQSNQYGVGAEKMASSGLSNTGYSESSRASMYNAYQNRVATARESYQRAERDYENAIRDAQFQNSSLLAEIAYNALKTQLSLSLQEFQYENTLLLELASTKRAIRSEYFNREMQIRNQILQEKAVDTESEFPQIEDKKPFADRNWKFSDDGGWNWFWGIDNNGEVTDEYGNTYTLEEVYEKLIDEEYSKKDAKEFVEDLQKDLGI